MRAKDLFLIREIASNIDIDYTFSKDEDNDGDWEDDSKEWEDEIYDD